MDRRGLGGGGGGGEGSRRGSSVKYHLSRSLLVNNVILNPFSRGGQKQTDGGSVSAPSPGEISSRRSLDGG